MDDLENIIKNMALPIALPPGSIMAIGKRRMPNFDLIFAQLPADLVAHINPNATAPGGDGFYLVPLKESYYLKLSIQDNSIIALEVVRT